MADDVLASFMVALGFRVDAGSQSAATKSVKDYEAAVRQAEKAIEDARWAGAQSAEEVAKLTRETNLKLAREALARAKDEEKAEAEKSQKRKERAKEFADGLAKMATAATAAAAAVGYAVGKVTSIFDNLYFQAQRSGTSVQSLRALGYAFSQVGGTSQQAAAAVDHFTTALRDNPGLRKFVQDLGVDDHLQGVDKLLATVDALNKREPYVTARQHAEILGISEGDYNLLTRQAEAIKKYRAEYDEITKRIGVNGDEAAKAATTFQRTLGTLQATAGALADKLLIQLAPALEKVTQGFIDWVKLHPEQVEQVVKRISDGIVWLTQKITALVEWFAGSDGEAFVKRWDNFSDRVAGIGRAFEAVWAILKKIDEWLHLSTIYSFIDKLGTAILAGPAAFERANQAALGAGAGGGGAVGRGPVAAADERTWWQRHAPRVLGGRDAPGEGGAGIRTRGRRAAAEFDAGRLNARQPEGPGRYRPEYKLGDADLDPKVVNTIAGEAIAKNPESVDAVINNMLNRVGSKGWGPSGNLRDVARAPGQYAGYRQAGPSESAFIQSRIKAIASGGVPDNTNGANSYRAAWYTGPWAQKHAADGRVVGGNRYGFEPGFSNGPYAPYAKPKDVPPPVSAPPAATMRGLPNTTAGGFDPNHIDPKNLMPAAPAGASPVTNNNTSSTSKAVTQHITNNVKVDGSREPREHGRVLESSLSRVHGLALANAQTAMV